MKNCIPIIALSLLLAAYLSAETATAPATQPTSQESKADTFLLVEVKGTIGGSFSAARMKAVLSEARREKPTAVVLYLDTPGGLVAEAEEIVDLIIEHKDLHFIALVRKALSAGVPITLACKEIYVTETATIGAAVSYFSGAGGRPVDLPPDVAEKHQSAWRAVCRKAADHGGHSSLLAEGMVARDFAITMRRVKDQVILERNGKGELLKAAGRILTLTAKEAVACGLARGVVSDVRGLGAKLGKPEWKAMRSVEDSEGVPNVMTILKRLEAAGSKYPNITAELDCKVDMLQIGDTEERIGKVYYQGPTDETPAKFRMHFDTLRQGTGPKVKDVVDYAFDGEWFIERKERIKQMNRYQAPPGEKNNLLQLGKGPFPVPFGQKAEDVIKHFQPSTRPAAPSTGSGQGETDPKDTDYLKLTTRQQYSKDFSVVWLEMWVDRKSGLPVKIVKEDRSENITTVIFTDIKTPKSFPEKTFDLPRPPAGWEYHVEKFKGQVKP